LNSGLLPNTAVFFVVRRFDVSPEIRAVHLDFPAYRLAGAFQRQGFPQLVGEDEGRLVLHVEVTAQLQGGMPLGTVAEDGNRGEDVTQRQLTAGEDRPGGHGELGVAALALEDAACGVSVDGQAAAAGAVRLALGLCPADRLERLKRFRIGHAHHLHEAQRPGFG